MTNDKRNPNDEILTLQPPRKLGFGHWDFFCHSSFVIRISALFLVLFGGLVSGAAPSAISDATNVIQDPFPVVGTDGSNYLVGMQFIRPDTTSEPVAQLVSSTGTLLGPTIKTGRTGDPPRAIAFGGNNYFMLWADYSSNSNGSVPVTGWLINRTGFTMGSPFQVSQSTSVERMDAAAFGGTNFLVTWTDRRRAGSGPGDKDIYARTVSIGGTPLGSDFKISGAGGAESAIAFDGFNFLVVWRDDYFDNDICGRFITATGEYASGEFFIDSNGLPSDNPSAVIWDGSRYVVVIEDEVGGAESETWDLFARFVNTFGGVDPNRVTISAASGAQRFPTLAYDGANYLVAWNDGLSLTNLGNTNVNIKARFFNPSGAAAGSEFNLFASQGSKIPINAALLFDGKKYFATAGLSQVLTNGSGGFNGFTNGTIYGTTVPSSTARPRLDFLPPFAGGQFKLRVSGTPGINYAVQATTNNLAPNSTWTSLVTTSTPPTGTFDFIDTNATNSSRFYRVIKQ